MTNILSLLQVPAAYKALILPLLIGEVNHVSTALDLPAISLISTQHVTSAFVGRPNYGVSGNLQTTNYDFTFINGSLHTVSRRGLLTGTRPLPEVYQELLSRSNLLDRSSAYQTATQWLSKLEVDVAKLEGRYQPSVVQRKFLSEFVVGAERSSSKGAKEGRERLLPIFDIRWGTNGLKAGEGAPVEIAVLGTTKELMYLRLKPPTPSARKAIELPDGAKELIPAPQAPSRPESSKSKSIWKRPPWAPPFDATPEALNVWYAERLGGSNKLEAIRSPETVTAVLIKKKAESKLGDYSASAFEIVSKSVDIETEEAMLVCSWLGDLSTFNLHLFPFAPDYCARLTFKRGNDTVECLVAVNETYLRLSSGEHFVPWLSYQGKPSLRHLLRRAFPEHEPFQ